MYGDYNWLEKVLQTEIRAWFQCPLKFLADVKIFWRIIFKKKKSNFLVFISRQVYAAILKDRFQNRQTYSYQVVETSLP